MELLAIGVKMLGDLPVPPSPPAAPKRGTAQQATQVIQDCFRRQNTWTPAELKKATCLTAYQVKTGLETLLKSGVVTKTGSTRSTLYRAAERREVRDASAA